MPVVAQTKKLLEFNPPLQKYYAAFESRIGYWLFLGGTRHFGYYQRGTKWPFPIARALRKMEDRVFDSLELLPGARVLDAGCGAGHVALHMARKGFYVQGIDIVSNHIQWARQKIQAEGFHDVITVRLMDYHHLDAFVDEFFDGVYTMETLVHATNPEKALGEFFRVIKRGGSIVLHEYAQDLEATAKNFPRDLKQSMEQIYSGASVPSAGTFSEQFLQRILEEQGFRNVVVEDLSENITPMTRLFFIIAYVPYFFICLLGLQAWFVNTQAGVQGHRVLQKGLWRYLAIRAKKPSNEVSCNSSSQVEDSIRAPNPISSISSCWEILRPS